MMDLPLNVDFTGKVVVITGAGGVICSTMARAFAQAGAKVAAINRTGIKVEKEYSLAVKVRATNDEMPAGLEKVLGMLGSTN